MHEFDEKNKPQRPGLGHNGPPIREGNWIALSRDVIEHHIVGAGQPVEAADRNKGSFSRFESWVDLLALANWAERKIDNQGVTTILMPGQTLAGRTYLAKRWNWTEKTVRNWLAKLERELMISLFCETAKHNSATLVNDSDESKRGQTRGHTRNIITICNWDKYQCVTVAHGPDLGPDKGHPGATQGPQKNKGTREQGNKKEEEPSVLSSGDDPQPIDALAAFSAYNALAQRVGLPVASTMTPARRKSIQARMREHGGIPAWERMLAMVDRSAYLQGSKGWMPNLDWLIKPANFVKVYEGAYGNGAHAKAKLNPTGQSEDYLERMRRLMGTSAAVEDIEILPPEAAHD